MLVKFRLCIYNLIINNIMKKWSFTNYAGQFGAFELKMLSSVLN